MGLRRIGGAVPAIADLNRIRSWYCHGTELSVELTREVGLWGRLRSSSPLFSRACGPGSPGPDVCVSLHAVLLVSRTTGSYLRRARSRS